jgi:radical SAM protein with 4Fe4S-binding SPASM domain
MYRTVEHRQGPPSRELAPVKKTIYSLIDLREIPLGCNRRYIAHRLKSEHGGRGGANGRMLWRTAGVNDGRGLVFVSHTGQIFPSGFLPVSAGDVRRESIVDVYRNSSLFRVLREATANVGKCGYCEYHKICGGSRARAYALTGNYLEADPRCTYQPSRQTELAHA